MPTNWCLPNTGALTVLVEMFEVIVYVYCFTLDIVGAHSRSFYLCCNKRMCLEKSGLALKSLDLRLVGLFAVNL